MGASTPKVVKVSQATSPPPPRSSRVTSQPTQQQATSTDDGFATSMMLGYAMNGLLITGLILWLLSFMLKETPPSAEAVRKNREFVERQAQKEVDTLEHFSGFEDKK